MFSSPSRSSTGTLTSVKDSSAVSEVLQAELVQLAADACSRRTWCPRPAARCRSGGRPALGGAVRAQTMTRSACTPPVMNVLAPLST